MWSNLDIKYCKIDTTENLVATWMPHLWGQTHNFPVSLTVTTFQDRFPLRDVLLPYVQRLQSLSLDIPQKPLSAFLFALPIHFDLLDSLTLDLTRGVPLERTQIPIQGPPLAVFTLLPRLRKLTLHSRSMVFTNALISSLSQLPWSQMKQITFLKVQVRFSDRENTLLKHRKVVQERGFE